MTKEKDMDRQYTNELTPELLVTMEQSPFTAEELAGMDNEREHSSLTSRNIVASILLMPYTVLQWMAALPERVEQFVQHTTETKSNFQMAGKLILL